VKNGVQVAIIEAVDLETLGYLPQGDTYALNLIDCVDFDFNSKTGNVRMIDLNYNYFLHSNITIKNDVILEWEAIALAYDDNEKLKSPNGVYSLCDSNGNNNISFSECYKCGVDAISADGFSLLVCAIASPHCLGSLAAACVYISIKY